jgi:hypothetical protein
MRLRVRVLVEWSHFAVGPWIEWQGDFVGAFHLGPLVFEAAWLEGRVSYADPYAGLTIVQRRVLAAIGALSDAGEPDAQITLPRLAEATGLPVDVVQAAALVLIEREMEALRDDA